MTKKTKKQNEKGIFIFLAVIAILSVGFFVSNNQKTLNSYESSQGERVYDWESYYGDDWEGYLQGELEEEGYEVINLFINEITVPTPLVYFFDDGDKLNCNSPSDYCIVNKREIKVKMKSLGNRADQIKRVIFDSSLIEDIYGFRIEILSPTNSCVYMIRWDDWVSCLGEGCNSDKFVSEDSLFSCE